MGILRNVLVFPSKLKEVKKQVKVQRDFIHKNLHPILSKYHHQNDGSLSAFDFDKITNYYGIGSPVLAGEGISGFLNKTISDSERKSLTFMAAITGLFDDFFDRSNQSLERIKGLMTLNEDIIASNSHEKLFQDLVKSILQTVKDKKRVQEYAEKVFLAQVESLKQKEKSLSWDELFYITYQKGGESLLFYRCSFDDEISPEEEKCLFKIGGLVQICNDVFDVSKDLKEGVRTILTEAHDIQIVHSKIDQLQKDTFGFCKSKFPHKNMDVLLEQIKFIVSQSLVALNFYQTTQNNNGKNFTPQKYPREALICDMGKKLNLLRAGFYWITK